MTHNLLKTHLLFAQTLSRCVHANHSLDDGLEQLSLTNRRSPSSLDIQSQTSTHLCLVPIHILVVLIVFRPILLAAHAESPTSVHAFGVWTPDGPCQQPVSD